MTFIYGAEGVIGFMINGISYLYRKNLFGDVTEIYNETRQLVGKYSYTAFGECTIEVDEQGIATKNPIRYRSYYYDEEINLYYLHTRYYDPEIGRFMNIDDVQYLDSETINGLNLYAYCLDNPIIYVDIVGQKPWRIGLVDYENLVRFPNLPNWLIMKGFYGEFEISIESTRSDTSFLKAAVGVIEFGYQNQFDMPDETPYGVTYGTFKAWLGIFNASAGIGLGFSIKAEIYSLNFSLKFNDWIGLEFKIIAGVNFTFDLSKGFRIGFGSFEISLVFDWIYFFKKLFGLV